MSDASILINGYRSDPHTAVPIGWKTEVDRADRAAASTGPFEHLLREIQQSARPRASRLKEAGASEMFESRPSAANSSRSDAAKNIDDASDLEANQAKRSTQDRLGADARYSRDGGQSDRSLALDSDRRTSAKPMGTPPDRVQTRSASDSPSASVNAGSPQAGESGSHAGGSASQSSAGAASTLDRSATSTPAPQPVSVAGASASSPREVPAPQQAASTSGAISTNDGPRSASVAEKLAPVLAELVRDGAKSPRPAAGSFQDELAKAARKQEQPHLRTTSDRATDPSRPTPEANSDHTVEPSPFDAFIRSIRMHGGESRSSARIRLNPPELGAMTVYVRVNGDRIRVEVRTETADAARRLQSHAADLKAALQQHGLSVDEVAVGTVDGIAAEFADAAPTDSLNATSRPPLPPGERGSVRPLPADETAKGSAIPPLPPRERGRGEGFLVWS